MPYVLTCFFFLYFFQAPAERNALIMGEFEVILELIAAHPEAKVAKAQVDKLIDLASNPPRGTGVQVRTR